MQKIAVYAWPVKRSMLLAGCVAVGCAIIAMNLPPWSLFVLAAAVLLSLLLPCCRRAAWVIGVLAAATVLCLGGAYRLLVERPSMQLIGQCATITAVIQDTPQGHMVPAVVTASDTVPAGTRILLYCPDQATPSRIETVCGEVEFHSLYTTQGRYRADGIFVQAYPTAYEEEAFAISPQQSSFAVTMEHMRMRLLGEINRRLPGEEGALLAGLCLGDLHGIAESTETAFRGAGLPHLLVVSGLHLSVVGGSAYALLRLLVRRRKTAALLTMGVVTAFSLIVGLSASVIRAGIACFVLFSGRLVYRRPDGLNSMGLALIILCMTSPYCLLDAGLVLSFGATAGILCLYQPLYNRLLFLGRWLASGLAITVAASLPIWPVLAYVFGEVSVASPLANLLTVGASGVALMLGCAALVCSLVLPLSFAANGLFFAAAWPMKWVRWIASVLGELPFATIPIQRVWVFLYLTGACCLGILCIYHRRALWRIWVVSLALVLLAVGMDKALAVRTTCVAVSVRYDRSAFLLTREQQRGLLVTQANGLYMDVRLLSECEAGLDFLVIGDGTTADAARLTDFLRQVPVDTVVIGGDGRWLTGLPYAYTVLSWDAPLLLCDGVSVTALRDGGWLLDCDGSTLALVPGGTTLAADAAVFIGNVPTSGGQYTLGKAALVGPPPAEMTDYPLTILPDGKGYLTARDGGDWSISRWR